MRIGLDNALGIHPQALQLRSQRTEVLARNIANADTPGYKSRDLDFKAVLQAQTSATGTQPQMRRTHAQHLQDNAPQSTPVELGYRLPLMPTLDGNTVESQVEQAAFAENALQFQASLRFLNGRLNGLLTAIKGE